MIQPHSQFKPFYTNCEQNKIIHYFKISVFCVVFTEISLPMVLWLLNGIMDELVLFPAVIAVFDQIKTQKFNLYYTRKKFWYSFFLDCRLMCINGLDMLRAIFYTILRLILCLWRHIYTEFLFQFCYIWKKHSMKFV